MKEVLPTEVIDMSTKAVKIAISLPKEDFKLLEALRKRIGLSRSALIYRAIHYWLAKREEEEKIKQYIEGYRRYPETPEELEELAAMEKVQLETMEKEDWS
ncbi:MAG: ribbon-helix-helix protein, CopG family [Candidatus Omnitrophica bacterium]|nr:ribbon-helix-helix protein, CopG family [Candidatus Omnitrophota bacterium]